LIILKATKAGYKIYNQKLWPVITFGKQHPPKRLGTNIKN